jgi:hypothetical protein
MMMMMMILIARARLLRKVWFWNLKNIFILFFRKDTQKMANTRTKYVKQREREREKVFQTLKPNTLRFVVVDDVDDDDAVITITIAITIRDRTLLLRNEGGL